MVRTGFEPATHGFQIRRYNHSATLPPLLLYRLYLTLTNENYVFVADIVLTNVRHCLFKQLWIFCGLQFVFRPSPTHVAGVLRATTLQLTYLPVQGRLIVMITTLNFWKFHQYLFWNIKLLETIKTAKPIQCCILLKGEFG